MQLQPIFLVLLACGQADEPELPASPMADRKIIAHAQATDGTMKVLYLVIPGKAVGNRGGAISILDGILEPKNFDRWLFDAKDATTARPRLLARLDAWVEAAARENGLDPAQAAKLRLAGKGDIERFLDEVEEKRKDFEARRKTFQEGFAFLRDLGPLAKRYQDGPFEGRSLFAKTLGKIQAEAGLPRRSMAVPPGTTTKPAAERAATPRPDAPPPQAVPARPGIAR